MYVWMMTSQYSIFPRTNKIMLGSRVVQYFLFHLWNTGEHYTLWNTVWKQSYWCASVFAFRCNRDYSITGPGIDLGSRYFSVKAGRIHEELSQPLGIPWLFPISFKISNPTSASLHRDTISTCACVRLLNMTLGTQAFYVWRQDLLREHLVLPQKGHWLTSSQSHVPIKAVECQIIKATVNLKYLI